ncbi:MAG: polysaccharide deacetylase family protein [Candidatus Lloydbacteria bacterium]|nr:polysaccharide deacetylase family protein [Candidatus Lloydbacteria bacterium]
MQKLITCIIVLCCLWILPLLEINVSAQQKEIALTFDDEIRPALFFGNGGLSETLKENGARATFFVLGYQVKSSPELFKTLTAQGQQIENHTWGHENLSKLVTWGGVDAALKNIEKTSSEILSVTGRRPKFFRPPYWAMPKDLKVALEKTGYRVMTIGSPDINTLDYEDAGKKRPSSVLASRVIKMITARETHGTYRHVLVFHQTLQTRDALREILPTLRQQGYCFVTLQEFFTLPEKAARETESLIQYVSFSETVLPVASDIFKPPETPVRALYLSIDNLSNKKKIASIERILETTDANALVIDFKIDAIAPEKIIRGLVEQFKKSNAYLIARISVMQDSRFARRNPGAALHRPDGSLWWSGRKEWGRYWVDPASPEVLAYAIDVAKRAIDLGFDEINFDYIRFPTDGDLRSIVYPIYDPRTATKSAVMNRFSSELTRALRAYHPNIKLSIDLFGEVVAFGHEKEIGQELSGAAAYFDVIAPMAYPSHYRCGTFGLKDPTVYPYLVYKKTLASAKKFLAKEHPNTAIRPWIQAFSITSIYRCGPYVPYGPEKIREQIQAGIDLDIPSFMLWNAGSHYSSGYFLAKK